MPALKLYKPDKQELGNFIHLLAENGYEVRLCRAEDDTLLCNIVAEDTLVETEDDEDILLSMTRVATRNICHTEMSLDEQQKWVHTFWDYYHRHSSREDGSNLPQNRISDDEGIN